MEDRKKYRIVIIVAFVALISLGMYIGFQVTAKGSNNDKIKDKDDEVAVYTPPVAQVVAKKSDIEIIYTDYYSVCSHSRTEQDMVYGSTIEKIKEDEIKKQKSDGLEYELVSSTSDKLEFKRVMNQYCSEHYNVKLENGIINIYNVINDGVEVLSRELNISVELIRPELLEELNRGIRVDSAQDLNLLIEDLES